MIIVLRLGPRLYLSPDNSSFLSELDEDDWESDNNPSSIDDDNDDVDVDRYSMKEMTRLLLGKIPEHKDVTIHAYSSTPVLNDFDKIASSKITYEEALQDLQFPKKKEVRLKPRSHKFRSLSPRALARARSRPTFHG